MKTLFALFASLGLIVISPLPACAKASASADPALWVVKDADTTIYLFGSVHVLKPGTVWFDDEIKAAFDRSGTLVLEMVAPPEADMAREIARLGVDPDGPPLSRKLDEAARAKYLAAMTQVGLPWQSFETLQPWMAGITLAVAPMKTLGYDPEAGVEKVLTGAAKAAGKQVEGLETVGQQLGYFAGLPEAQQIAFLNETVDALPKAETEFATLVANWKAGRPDALAKEMNESLEATPELAQVLLYGRNAHWAHWIADRMKQPGTVFIAVGAGHLAGAKSVQDQLRALGVKTKRVGKRDFGLR